MRTEFSTEKAIEIQTKQLKEWKSKLLPHVYKAVHERTIRDNDKAENGYQIFRGNDIDTAILNYPNIRL